MGCVPGEWAARVAPVTESPEPDVRTFPGARRPDRHSLILFCLRGLGADVDEAWVADVEDRLVLPKGKGRGLGPGPRAKRAPRKSKDSGPTAS